MGMRIQGSGAAGASQSASATQWQKQQQDFKGLMSAVQSGDLGAAQTAFAALTGNTGTVKGSSPLAQIGQALQSGDIGAAQQAAQQLLASRHGHHHHHAPDVQTATITPSTAAAISVGSTLNVSA